jgi:hypothetical protein
MKIQLTKSEKNALNKVSEIMELTNYNENIYKVRNTDKDTTEINIDSGFVTNVLKTFAQYIPQIKNIFSTIEFLFNGLDSQLKRIEEEAEKKIKKEIEITNVKKIDLQKKVAA